GSGRLPAWSIFIANDVPDRGRPETTTMGGPDRSRRDRRLRNPIDGRAAARLVLAVCINNTSMVPQIGSCVTMRSLGGRSETGGCFAELIVSRADHGRVSRTRLAST